MTGRGRGNRRHSRRHHSRRHTLQMLNAILVIGGLLLLPAAGRADADVFLR
jgi:uncharacterized paraquat-inducible protein A